MDLGQFYGLIYVRSKLAINSCFDPWHMPVAQFYKKLYFQGVTCGTRVYGHVAHLAMVWMDSVTPRTPTLTPQTCL